MISKNCKNHWPMVKLRCLSQVFKAVYSWLLPCRFLSYFSIGTLKLAESISSPFSGYFMQILAPGFARGFHPACLFPTQQILSACPSEVRSAASAPFSVDLGLFPSLCSSGICYLVLAFKIVLPCIAPYFIYYRPLSQ